MTDHRDDGPDVVPAPPDGSPAEPQAEPAPSGSQRELPAEPQSEPGEPQPPATASVEPPPPEQPLTALATGGPSAGATLADVIAALRRRAWRVHGGFAASLFAAFGCVALLLSAVALGLGAGSWVLGVLVLVVLLALAVALEFANSKAGRAPAAELARALEAREPRAAGLSTAVSLDAALDQLDAAPPAARPFSPELARAHIAVAADRAFVADVNLAFDLRPLRRAAAAAGLAMAVLVGAAFLSSTVSRGLSRLGREKPAEKGAEPQARVAPITGEVKLTYVYPAHTRLPAKVVQGTTGEITAPRGTQVKLETRADRDVARAFVELDGTAQPLEVTGSRDLAGNLLVQRSGKYVFRFEDGGGATLAIGPPIGITVIEDGAPQIRIQAPVPELVVGERDRLEVQWEATDDFGVARVELVYKVGAGEEKVAPVASPAEAPRRTEGTHPWELAALGLHPGDEVSYYLRATDDDGVQGGKPGQSRTQRLKVFSEAEHRRELLAKVEEAWNQLVSALGERITPREGPRKVEGPARVSAGKPADAEVMRVTSELKVLSDELRRDRKAPKELTAATVNIVAGLAQRSRDTRQTRALTERAGPSPTPPALKRLDGAELAEQQELEKDVLYLEALLDRARLHELRELAREMAASRRELGRLLEQYKEAPTDQVKQQIQEEIARLKSRMNELMRKMSELGKQIQDEHLNAEAMKALSKEQDLMSELDEIQKLLNEGKIDEAMAKLQELGMKMDELQAKLDEAQDGQTENSPEMKELAKELQQFEQELSELQAKQQELARETEAQKREYQKQIQEELEQKGEELLNELRRQVEKAKVQLGDVPEEALPAYGRENDLGGAQERLDDLDHALAAKDFDAARESAGSALDHAGNLSEDLQRELEVSRRFRGGEGNPDVPRAAAKAAAAQKTIADVKDKLDRMLPDPSERMSQQQKDELKKLAEKQRGAGQQLEKLKQLAEKIGQKAPVFDPRAQAAMEGAQGSMGEAEERLRGPDPGGALAAERRASEQLDALQQGLEKTKERARQNKGGGGFPLPLAMGGEGNGEEEGMDGDPSSKEKVLIPGADQYKVPEEFRRDILEAMKRGSPEAFKEHVKEYYEEIVK